MGMKKSQDVVVDRGAYLLFTLVVVGLGWVIAAANTGISYLALGMDVIPIVTGLIGCLVFAILLRFLHYAWWLAFSSLLPAVSVLVGSVQYAPEAALDSRGVRETVRIAADSGVGGGSNHRFTLIGQAGKLKETLDYDGDARSGRWGTASRSSGTRRASSRWRRPPTSIRAASSALSPWVSPDGRASPCWPAGAVSYGAVRVGAPRSTTSTEPRRP
nr:hypothetical protein [Streptomyces sabulosicollis]